MSACVWRNPWRDSGDRGAAQVDHDRECHPDHEHTFADSTYAWEQAGQTWIAPGDRTLVTIRPTTAQRCTVCSLSPDRVRECRP